MFDLTVAGDNVQVLRTNDHSQRVRFKIVRDTPVLHAVNQGFGFPISYGGPSVPYVVISGEELRTGHLHLMPMHDTSYLRLEGSELPRVACTQLL